MLEVNDELMMPCAQCCKKHLSAAIAYYCVAKSDIPTSYGHVLAARALINYAESLSGYKSHLPFAMGLLVMAEEADPYHQRDLAIACRETRLQLAEGSLTPTGVFAYPFEYSDMYQAHLDEAYREFPSIRTAVDREPFYRDNMSEPELRQAEINFRLAQIKWLDENIFGIKPVEKGEDQMACKKKQAAAKGGDTMEPAKKAAAKGGKSAKGGCKGGCKK